MNEYINDQMLYINRLESIVNHNANSTDRTIDDTLRSFVQMFNIHSVATVVHDNNEDTDIIDSDATTVDDNIPTIDNNQATIDALSAATNRSSPRYRHVNTPSIMTSINHQ